MKRTSNKILSLLLSLLMVFSPTASPCASVDYLIGTLGNAFSGRIEGGAALFEIESGLIGAEFADKDKHPLIEMAGNIAKISAGAGTDAYFLVDGIGEGEEIGQSKVKASVRLIGGSDSWDLNRDDKGNFSYTSKNGKVKVYLLNVTLDEDYEHNTVSGDLVISVDNIDEKIQIQRLGLVSDTERLALAATIVGNHTAYTTVEGMIDGKYSNYSEIRTYDDSGMLWRTSSSGIRSGDVVGTTTYNGYDQLTGELKYTYTYGNSNGAFNNYVEFLKYDRDGRPAENIRTGLVGGDTYGDGDFVIEDDDYITTNIYENATLVSVHVEGQINGRRSNFNRDFTYDSLGRVTETTYSPFDAQHITDNQWDDYVIVNGAVYGGEKAGEKYAEITTYGSDGNVGTLRRSGVIDGYRDSYSQTYTYTKRGQIKETLTNGTVRGNSYTNLKESNIIVKENTMNSATALSDINSGRTLASITDGFINGAKSNVVTRYKYDNDGFNDDSPFEATDRIGRQLATYTRGIRDATYYGDGKEASRENYDLKEIIMLSGLFPVLDKEHDRALTSYERELIKLTKLMGGSVTLKDKLSENHTIQFDGVTIDTSFVTYSKYDEVSGQVIKTQTGIKINIGAPADPVNVIKGGMINATENFYSTVYEYDTDTPALAATGLGREVKTATRGIRGGRIYGLLDSDHTVESLDWDKGPEDKNLGKVDAIADYVEANTYYTFDDINADTHLFRLKSTHTKGWTDGEVNDYARKLDYDNDGVGVTWEGGKLKTEVGVSVDKVKGDGRIVRTITSGIVSARCYGNTCDAKATQDFDLTELGNDFHFGFVKENDKGEEIPDPTANIYQEVSAYDSQGRVVFAKNLGLINGAKDNYRADYFYETGTDMVGRQQKSVTNSKAVGDGNAIVNASIRINYVEETVYDDSLIDIDKDDPKGRGLRKSVEVTGFDGGAFNNYVQLFKYQEHTGANTYENIAGRMNEVRYRGMRGGSVSGYFKGVTKEMTLNAALNDLSATTPDKPDGWVESADFVQRLVYAEVDNADSRAGQQKWVETEGTSAGVSNDYRTLNGYDALGRQSSRKIEGVHEFSKLKIVDDPLNNGEAPDVTYDSNSGDGYGIVGGMFSKSNEIMAYSSNGSLSYISNFDGFSERIEESVVFHGEDNYKRVFLYMDELSNDNEFFGQDNGYIYKANDGYLAPIVGGSGYFGADQVKESETGSTVTDTLRNNPCLGENCSYKVNYTYDRRGQRLTQYSFGYQGVAKVSSIIDNGTNVGANIPVTKDLYTTTFGYDQYGRTAKTAYNIDAWIRGARYGSAPLNNGKKAAPDKEYVTTYKYDDLGFQTSQQSIGYKGASFDNFTRTNFTEYTNKAGRSFANYWGRAIASSITGFEGGQTKLGFVSASPEALRVMFNGLDDGKDPLADACGADNGDACYEKRSYNFKIGEKGDTFTVFRDTDEDGISGEVDVKGEQVQYEIVAQDGLEGNLDKLPDPPGTGNGKYDISLAYELKRRIIDSVTKVIVPPLSGEEYFSYGDMYNGPRPCVRQVDGTLNCAH